MRRDNDNIVSKHYKEYNHTSEDYTVTTIDKEADYNKRLRLEEAWIFLLESMYPKGLKQQNVSLEIWGFKETTPNYQSWIEMAQFRNNTMTVEFLPT